MQCMHVYGRVLIDVDVRAGSDQRLRTHTMNERCDDRELGKGRKRRNQTKASL